MGWTPLEERVRQGVRKARRLVTHPRITDDTTRQNLMGLWYAAGHRDLASVPKRVEWYFREICHRRAEYIDVLCTVVEPYRGWVEANISLQSRPGILSLSHTSSRLPGHIFYENMLYRYLKRAVDVADVIGSIVQERLLIDMAASNLIRDAMVNGKNTTEVRDYLGQLYKNNPEKFLYP